MKRFVLGWLVGLATFWLVATVSGGWYQYMLWGRGECAAESGWLAPGTEIQIAPDGRCVLRTARFHLP